jgi:DNA repair exonuclease SbcCD ATPase subunit
VGDVELIKTLTLKNFGPVASASVDFGAIVAVVGENNAGKSMAVFNALEIALLGKSFSASYVRDGFTSGSVSVEFTDGRRVTRKSENGVQTTILEEGGSKTTLKGADVKDEVQTFTGFTKTSLGGNKDTHLQFMAVGDPPHWLVTGSSPTTVLETVVAATGSLGFENSRSAIKSIVSAKKQEATAYDNLLNEQRKITQYVEQNDLRNRLANFLTQIAEVGSNLDSYDLHKTALEKVKSRIQGYLANQSGLEELQSMWVSYTPQLEKEIAMFEMLEENVHELKARKAKLQSLEDRVDRLQKSVTYYEEELSRINEELKNAPEEVCPTCGQLMPSM